MNFDSFDCAAASFTGAFSSPPCCWPLSSFSCSFSFSSFSCSFSCCCCCCWAGRRGGRTGASVVGTGIDSAAAMWSGSNNEAVPGHVVVSVPTWTTAKGVSLAAKSVSASLSAVRGGVVTIQKKLANRNQCEKTESMYTRTQYMHDTCISNAN